MRFTPQLLDEIRARLPVSHVVGKRVPLKRQGREMAGLSPFKAEKTASFFVNDAKGFYHCFASGEHGDIFTFLMKIEGLAFPEAVERLAAEAGVALPAASASDHEAASRYERLRLVMAAADDFFRRQLANNNGAGARDYLDRRGVAQVMRERFGLGFAPSDRHALKQVLAGAGFTQEEMIEAGLLIAGEDIPVSYDRFRNRLMFPIRDPRGRTIAFGGRALYPDANAKYLNSPETPLFHKGATLYNADLARGPAHDRERIVVVEGYMDVIASASAGVGETVAPLGTALTDDQVKLLWRMADEPILCFDGDEAGQRAASRAIEVALPLLSAGKSLRFAFMPPGLDPDDLIRAQGAAAFTDALSRARPLAEILWSREVEAGPLDTPERRAAFEQRLGVLIHSIADAHVQRHYRADLRARVAALWRPPERAARSFERKRTPTRGGGNRAPQRGFRPQREEASESLLRSGIVGAKHSFIHPREALIALTLINHPFLAEEHPDDVARLSFESAGLSALTDAILEAAATENALDSQGVRHHLDARALGGVVKSVESALRHRCDGFAQPGADRASVEAGWRHVTTLHRASYELKRELEAAERAFQSEQSADSYERLEAARLQLLAMERPEARETEERPQTGRLAGRVRS